MRTRAHTPVVGTSINKFCILKQVCVVLQSLLSLSSSLHHFIYKHHILAALLNRIRDVTWQVPTRLSEGALDTTSHQLYHLVSSSKTS
jgi:hypothetical protein